ncbi:MAG: glycosyltransferase [Candidatus Dadabacteria bacterium]|nr:glycosyltransferase [Candidatus Dadabacteria bacterium]
MKALLVIHGYPRRYNAGSEVYTQTLAHALSDKGCEVEVFARQEDPFLPDYTLQTETDPVRDNIPVHLVNHARSNSRFQNHHIDKVFERVIHSASPDIVHFGHLNHLSMGLPLVAKSCGLPVVFTLHDFWLMCPRGQFLQCGLSSGEPWSICDGQENRKCATQCYNRFIEGVRPDEETRYWERWIGNRMEQAHRTCDNVDLFIAPSRHLMCRYVNEFGLEEEKTVFTDYGFDRDRYKGRQRECEKDFVFGFIGRHSPSKGIHLLIEAFSGIPGGARLRIWGRAEGQLTASLKHQAADYPNTASRIEWMSEYRNEDIVRDVFNRCDCIVVPSIWDENSPLVIHEAQQCRVPVITASHGGMGEYVKNGENGLTFRHRDSDDLRTAMRAAVADPVSLKRMGKRGYLFSDDGQIPCARRHADEVLRHYGRLTQGASQSGREASS